MAVAPAATRPRPGGGRLFIIVGVLLAAAAFGGVFLLGNLGGTGGALGGPSTTVVIAKQQIPLRHQITAADLETAKSLRKRAHRPVARPKPALHNPDPALAAGPRKTLHRRRRSRDR